MFEVWKTYEILVYLILVALAFLKKLLWYLSKLPHCIKVTLVDGICFLCANCWVVDLSEKSTSLHFASFQSSYCLAKANLFAFMTGVKKVFFAGLNTFRLKS